MKATVAAVLVLALVGVLGCGSSGGGNYSTSTPNSTKEEAKPSIDKDGNPPEVVALLRDIRKHQKLAKEAREPLNKEQDRLSKERDDLHKAYLAANTTAEKERLQKAKSANVDAYNASVKQYNEVKKDPNDSYTKLVKLVGNDKAHTLFLTWVDVYGD